MQILKKKRFLKKFRENILKIMEVRKFLRLGTRSTRVVRHFNTPTIWVFGRHRRIVAVPLIFNFSLFLVLIYLFLYFFNIIQG